MRLSTPSSLLFLSLCSAPAFGFVSPSTPSRQWSCLAVTAEEAAARAGAAAAGLKPAPQPKLYEDDLLTDMQQCLLKLERRVQDGPGALSVSEVEEFQFATQRILDEMKLNEHNRPKPAPAFPDALLEEELTAAQPQAADKPKGTGAVNEYVIPGMEAESQSDEEVEMTEEGPQYDGTGGMGLAKGTTNTYVIPGMDEMSPEEYQKALQASISGRQAGRVSRGKTGNRNSNDYLNNLGEGTKYTGLLNYKKETDSESEDNVSHSLKFKYSENED